MVWMANIKQMLVSIFVHDNFLEFSIFLIVCIFINFQRAFFVCLGHLLSKPSTSGERVTQEAVQGE